MHLIDFIVTRKQKDPRQYSRVLRHPLVNIIEVDFVPGSVIQARQDLIQYGNAPYITWFDPDDDLYRFTMDIFLKELVTNPDLDAVLMLSDTYFTTGSKQINLEKFHESPVNCHLMRAIKRTWLEENIELFNHPVPEWPLLAKLLTANTIIIPRSGYSWRPSTGSTHNSITSEQIKSTRDVVQGILGCKYDYTAKIKRYT